MSYRERRRFEILFQLQKRFESNPRLDRTKHCELRPNCQRLSREVPEIGQGRAVLGTEKDRFIKYSNHMITKHLKSERLTFWTLFARFSNGLTM